MVPRPLEALTTIQSISLFPWISSLFLLPSTYRTVFACLCINQTGGHETFPTTPYHSWVSTILRRIAQREIDNMQ